MLRQQLNEQRELTFGDFSKVFTFVKVVQIVLTQSLFPKKYAIKVPFQKNT